MTYEFSARIKAFTLAFAVNTVLLAAAGYLFDGRLHTRHVALMALDASGERSAAWSRGLSFLLLG